MWAKDLPKVRLAEGALQLPAGSYPAIPRRNELAQMLPKSVLPATDLRPVYKPFQPNPKCRENKERRNGYASATRAIDCP